MSDSHTHLSDDAIQQWLKTAPVSIAAAAALNRKMARDVAKVSLATLFEITENNYGATLAIVQHVADFGTRRVIMENFRHAFIVASQQSDLAPLLEPVDFATIQAAARYDTTLQKILNRNEGKRDAVKAALSGLPLRARRIALQRLDHPDFGKHRRIQHHQGAPSLQDVFGQDKGRFKLVFWGLAVCAIALIAFHFGTQR